ncbi:hypothetical protein [Metabacillus indicus]|uniref:hypothetical protein n=1 Tax=Metabacillus indicus TaxID=246786 RepID=UPI00049362A5|nr:hypothetical protein [Metabacillus indicus]KEZ48801.1 hypothetical protein AZ46_0218130 [Metabacillus indicus LMG 22858]
MKLTKKLNGFILAAAVGVFSLGGVNANEVEASELPIAFQIQAKLIQFIKLDPELDMLQLKNDTIEYLRDNRIAYSDEVLLNQLNASYEEYRLALEEADEGYAASGGAPKVWVTLPPAHAGKIFHSKSSTVGVQHGHVGIYGTENSLTQANPGRGVTWDHAKSTKVQKGSVILGVNVGKATADTAVARSKEFWGQGYNYNFISNKSTKVKAANCSQLVWAAYKHAGVDLDANGGSGVYPNDILKDNNTWVYQTVN